HVIESFRNALWAGYKTGEGIDPVLRAQFELLEEALGALGVVVWPMVEHEADDALGTAAAMAAADARVEQAVICTPDKDLEQRGRALLFRELATLRTDVPIGVDVDGLRWSGPRPDFASWAERLGAPALHERAARVAAARSPRR